MHLLLKLPQRFRQFPWYVTAALVLRRVVALVLFTSGVWMLHFLLAGRPLDTVWSDDYLDEAAVTHITVPIERAGSALVEKRFDHLMSRKVALHFPELTQTTVDQVNREWKVTSLSNTVMRAHVSSQAEKDEAAASPPSAFSQSALANLSVHTKDGRCLLWDFMPIDRRIPGGVCPDDLSIDWIVFYVEWRDGVRLITDFQLSVPLARLLLGLPGKTDPISPFDQPRLDRFVAWLQSEFRQDQADALAAAGKSTAYSTADLSALASFVAAANLVDRCILYKLAVAPSDWSSTRSGKQGRRLVEAELTRANRNWLRLFDPAIRKYSFQDLHLRNQRLRRSCLIWLGLAGFGLLQFCGTNVLGLIAFELRQSRLMRFGRFVRLTAAYAPVVLVPVVPARLLGQRIARACVALPNREAVAAIKREARRVWRTLDLSGMMRRRADILIQVYQCICSASADVRSRDLSRRLGQLLEAQEQCQGQARLGIARPWPAYVRIQLPVQPSPIEPVAVRQPVEPEPEQRAQTILRLTKSVPDELDATLWDLSLNNLNYLERVLPCLERLNAPQAIRLLLGRDDLRQQLQCHSPLVRATLREDLPRLARLLGLGKEDWVDPSVAPNHPEGTTDQTSYQVLRGLSVWCIVADPRLEPAFQSALAQLGADEVAVLDGRRRLKLANALASSQMPDLVVISLAMRTPHTVRFQAKHAGLNGRIVLVDAVSPDVIRHELLERIPRSLLAAV